MKLEKIFYGIVAICLTLLIGVLCLSTIMRVVDGDGVDGTAISLILILGGCWYILIRSWLNY